MRLAGGEKLEPGIVPGPQQSAWFEINETTAPPPAAPSHVLPNRTRLPVEGSLQAR
jgi:hypothetical protein